MNMSIKMRKFPVALFLLLALLAALGGTPVGSPLRGAEAASRLPAGIQSFAPTGRVPDNAPFRVVFKNPMVSKARIGKSVAVKDFPFTVSPPIQAEGQWQNDRTFTARLLAPLKGATSYAAELKPGLEDRRGGKVGPGAFQFNTGALEAVANGPAGLSAVIEGSPGDAQRARLTLTFNMPVSPARLRGFLRVVNEQGRELSYTLASQLPGRSIPILAPLADATKRQTLTVHVAKGFTAQDGDLGLAQDYKASVTLQPTLNVTGLEAGEGFIRANFNFKVSPETARAFVALTPAVPFTVEGSYDDHQLFIRGDFKPRDRFTVTLKRGLPAGGKLTLAQDFTQALIMPDLEPAVSLPASGSYLVPGGLIPLELTNIKRLQVDLWQLYENNIPFVIRGDWNNFQKDLASRVYSREFTLSLPLNERVRRSLDLADLAGDRKGLFLLTVRDLNQPWWSEESQMVNLSDLGAVARVWEDGLLLWVNTLSAAQAVEGAEVRVYSGANQLLAQGTTGADGVFLHERGEAWDQKDAPRLAVISKGEELTYVQLTHGLLSKEIFDTAGRPWTREGGYDALVLSPRDIYRTGEEASFKAIVRDARMEAPNPSFPVLFVARDPLGRKVRQELVPMNAEGSALFTLPLPSNALTGRWTLALTVPGQEEKPLASLSFHVEDFAPPRIEVKLDSDEGPLTQGDVFRAGIQARWLFGVDGAGLAYRASWQAQAADFAPKQERWRGYEFGDPERSFTRVDGVIGEGNLDGEGRAVTSLTLDAPWEAPSTIAVTLRAEVMEDGGRWVSKSVTRTFFPTPWLLGIAPASAQMAVGQDAAFKIAAIGPDESPANPGELNAELFRVRWNYNLVEVDGVRRWQGSEELVNVTEKAVTLKNGLGSVSFRPSEWGTYLVRVSDRDGLARTALRFTATDPAYAAKAGSPLLDRVEVATDREFYRSGETAKIALRVPFEGLLLVNVEGQKLLFRYVLKADKAEVSLEVPVTEAMVPNAWVSAWLIRPVQEETAWGAHRAVGLARIKADLSDYRLAASLNAPERAEPASTLPVALTLTDASGQPAANADVALALVDDGVLNLTGYKTPDLLNHFWGLRELGSEGYDLYDQLIPLEARAAPLLHPAGGEAMGALAAASDVRRFKILSLFDGALRTDEKGTVTANLELPEFSGRGRLFAVAASGSRFGLAEQPVQIARSVVTEATLPRFAAPGDTFIVPITVFNTAGDAREVKLSLEARGGLTLEGESEKVFSVNPSESASWSVPVRALDGHDSATWAAVTSWTEGGAPKEFRQEVDLPIRSPWPVVARSGAGTFEAGRTEIRVPLRAFSGVPSGALTLADTPAASATQAVEALKNYPYGCLEQTISTAWPFLILPDAVAAMDPLLLGDAALQDRTAAALSRLQAMQLYDGSFEDWPGSGRPYNWGSVYAAHFLLDARDTGVSYPEEMLTGVMNWLRQFMASMPAYRTDADERDDFTAKAYGAYVLTRYGERPLGWVEYLRENQDRLWPSGRIWLAGAQALLDGRPEALRGVKAGGTIPPEARARVLESEARNTAQLLSLWLEVDPQAPEALELAVRLAKGAGQWHGTQDNALALMALARWNLLVGGDKANLKGTLIGDGKTLLTYESGKTASLTLPDENGAARLQLDLTGEGTGYYAWTLTGTPKSAPEPESRGLEAECLWMDERGNILDLSRPVAHGTRLQGILTLRPTLPVSNLAVSCLLPAGFELENPRLEGETGGDAIIDVRDDRLLLFFDRLDGERTYGFKVRAVTRGTFAVPPLSALGMYDPSVAFTGESGPQLVIE